MNVQRRIGLSLFALAIVNILIIGIYSNIISQDALKNRSESYLASILKRNKQDINQNIRIVENNVSSLKEDIDLSYNYRKDVADTSYRALYLDAIKPTIRIAAELSPSKSAYLIFINSDNKDFRYDYIWYSDYNFDGRPEYNTEKDLFYDLDVEKILTKLSKTETLYWHINNSNDKTYITCLVPVIRDNEIVAIIGNDINFQKIKSLIDSTVYLNSGEIYLIGVENEYIYHPNKKVYQQLGIEYIDRSMITQENINILDNIYDDSQSYILTSTQLRNGWFLEMSVTVSDVYDGLEDINNLIVTMVIISMVITLIFSALMAKYISEPYRYLIGIVEKIGLGNYNLQIENKYFNRKDEVGTLSNAIEQMVERQNDSFDEIKNYNDNLEKIIDDRTDELVKTNYALEESIANVEEKHEALELSNTQLEQSLLEIEETKDKLLQAEKIASLRNIIIGVAHNMNTPVGNAITLTSYNEKMTRDMEKIISQSAIKKSVLLQHLQESNEVSLKIMDNLTSVTEIIDKFKELTNDTSSTETIPIFIKELVEIQLELAGKKYKTQSCHCHINVDPDLRFLGDLYSLQKIFVELIDNSFLHGFEGVDSPGIYVEAQYIDDSKRDIIIHYSDNGQGITTDEEKEIFAPMYTSKLASSYGLGLSMVYNLIHQTFKGEIVLDENSYYNGLGYKIILRSTDTEGVDNS